MEGLMFVCPLPKTCAGLCNYISNSVAQFHFILYFSKVDADTILLGEKAYHQLRVWSVLPALMPIVFNYVSFAYWEQT